MTTNEQNVSAAQELRAAASKIRDAKHWAMPGPWFAGTEDVQTDWHPDSEEFKQAGNRDLDVASDTGPGNAAHIALWHPGVAELVAEWLDAEALGVEAALARFPGINAENIVGWPLRIARAITGGAR